ncbi:MAG: hypothetical protein ACD_10C00233G0001 [uncultured bacterium]|nr:MAG: hypothetical protein ACD_10C00233G0001 [uncultured bacterium]
MIDHDAGFLPGVLHYDDIFAGWPFAFDLEHFTQADKGQHFAAQIVEIAVGGVITLFDAFDDHIERNDVGRFADPDQKAVDDGQRQRQANSEGGAFAFDAGYVAIAAQALNIAPHDIHADPASGKIGHLIGGRKSRFPDQIDDFLIGQGLGRLDQPLFDGFVENFVARQAAAIVDHFDNDAA